MKANLLKNLLLFMLCLAFCFSLSACISTPNGETDSVHNGNGSK